MTSEQKDRIQKAARELGAALTEVGGYFDVTTNLINVTKMDRKNDRWAYEIFIKVTTEEVIA